MDFHKLMAMARESGFTQLHGTTFPGCAMTPEALAKFAAKSKAEGIRQIAGRCSEAMRDDLLAEADAVERGIL